MRQALNDNPIVQAAVLALVGIAFAVLMFTSVLKKEEEPPPPATVDATATGAPVAPEAAAVAPEATVAPAVPAPPAVDSTGTAPTASGSGDGLAPSEGLPKNVLSAYEQGKAVALFVVDPKARQPFPGFAAVRGLSSDEVQVVVVDVKDIAKYSRITLGVAVSRTPALVVVRPRELSAGGPSAVVEYELPSLDSVELAIDEAFYEGPTVPVYP